MAKAAKKKKSITLVNKKERQPFTISNRIQDVIFLSIIMVLLLVVLKPFVFDRLSPQGVDVVASLGSGHQIVEYQKETGERALWNPNIFAGMPTYHRLSPAAYSFDTLLNFLSRFFNRIFIYYFFAAISFYALLRYLKMTPFIAFAGTLLYILMPHYKPLYLEGHWTKFKALMFLPSIFLAFKYFLNTRTLLAAALFSLAFGLQIRTQHYQIFFYTALLIFAVGVTPFLKDLLQKKYMRFGKSTVLLISGIILAITMSAQPLFLAKEYLPYSKRGKTTIDVKDRPGSNKNVGKADGVSMQYATQWSTHPSELVTWLVPRFYGGMSAEKYQGDAVPQAKGQMIPGYWGHMPFTQSYEYMGAITLLLALIGLFVYRKELWVQSMALFAVFLIFLSFGRHFESFYSLFFNYVPFFNKFRAPMMSVTVTFFIVSFLAAYGLRYLSGLVVEKNSLKEFKTIYYLLGGFFLFGIIIWLAGQGFSFEKLSGERYQGQTLELIKQIRMEYFNADIQRYLLIILLAGGGIVAFLMKKINFTVLAIALIIISVVDLLNIQGRLSFLGYPLQLLWRR